MLWYGFRLVRECLDTSWVGAALGINGIHPPTATHWRMPGTWLPHYVLPLGVRGRLVADTHKKPMNLSWYSCAGLSWCMGGIRPLDGPFHPSIVYVLFN